MIRNQYLELKPYEVYETSSCYKAIYICRSNDKTFLIFCPYSKKIFGALLLLCQQESVFK